MPPLVTRWEDNLAKQKNTYICIKTRTREEYALRAAWKRSMHRARVKSRNFHLPAQITSFLSNHPYIRTLCLSSWHRDPSVSGSPVWTIGLVFTMRHFIRCHRRIAIIAVSAVERVRRVFLICANYREAKRHLKHNRGNRSRRTDNKKSRDTRNYIIVLYAATCYRIAIYNGLNINYFGKQIRTFFFYC